MQVLQMRPRKNTWRKKPGVPDSLWVLIGAQEPHGEGDRKVWMRPKESNRRKASGAPDSLQVPGGQVPGGQVPQRQREEGGRKVPAAWVTMLLVYPRLRWEAAGAPTAGALSHPTRKSPGHTNPRPSWCTRARGGAAEGPAELRRTPRLPWWCTTGRGSGVPEGMPTREANHWPALPHRKTVPQEESVQWGLQHQTTALQVHGVHWGLKCQTTALHVQCVMWEALPRAARWWGPQC